MFTLVQFNINDQAETRLEGSAQEMRRAMREFMGWANQEMVAAHALLLNPQGQVVATS